MINEIDQYWEDLKALYELDKEQVKEFDSSSNPIASDEETADAEVKRRYCDVYEALSKMPKHKRYAIIAHQILPNQDACALYNKLMLTNLDPTTFSHLVRGYYNQVAKRATETSEQKHIISYEEEAIINAIIESRNLSGARKKLGLSKHRLEKVMKELNLPEGAIALRDYIVKKYDKKFTWTHFKSEPPTVTKDEVVNKLVELRDVKEAAKALGLNTPRMKATLLFYGMPYLERGLRSYIYENYRIDVDFKNIKKPDVSEKELIEGIIKNRNISQYSKSIKVSQSVIYKWLEYYGYPSNYRELEKYISKYVDASYSKRYKKKPDVTLDEVINAILDTKSIAGTMNKLQLSPFRFSKALLYYEIPTRAKLLAEYIRKNYDKDFKLIMKKNKFVTKYV